MASAVVDRDATAAGAVAVRRHWLMTPWIDIVFVANAAWPLLLLVQWKDGFDGRAGLQFWQVYFVTTPHRWITLALVAMDRDRLRPGRPVYLGLAAAVVLGCSTVWWSTGTLTCLLTIDYIWNAWHFAAQHQGIYRIYGRLSDPASGWRQSIERWGLRLFLLYVTLRVAIATWTEPASQTTFDSLDWLVAVIPLAMLTRDAIRSSCIATGQIVYLLSISTLYLLLLWSVHMHRPALALSLTTASALFHALEYLAIVNWRIRQRHGATDKDQDRVGTLASQWLMSLTIFVVVLGSGAWLLEHHWARPWLFVNVIVAYLHYAFDGLIWRRPSRGHLVALPAGDALRSSAT